MSPNAVGRSRHISPKLRPDRDPTGAKPCTGRTCHLRAEQKMLHTATSERSSGRDARPQCQRSWQHMVTPRKDRPSQSYAEGVSPPHSAQGGVPGPYSQEFSHADKGLRLGLLCLEPASQNKCGCRNISSWHRPHAHNARCRSAHVRPQPATNKGPGQVGRWEGVCLAVTSRVGTRQHGRHPEGQAGVRDAAQGGDPGRGRSSDPELWRWWGQA